MKSDLVNPLEEISTADFNASQAQKHKWDEARWAMLTAQKKAESAREKNKKNASELEQNYVIRKSDFEESERLTAHVLGQTCEKVEVATIRGICSYLRAWQGFIQSANSQLELLLPELEKIEQLSNQAVHKIGEKPSESSRAAETSGIPEGFRLNHLGVLVKIESEKKSKSKSSSSSSSSFEDLPISSPKAFAPSKSLMGGIRLSSSDESEEEKKRKIQERAKLRAEAMSKKDTKKAAPKSVNDAMANIDDEIEADLEREKKERAALRGGAISPPITRKGSNAGRDPKDLKSVAVTTPKKGKAAKSSSSSSSSSSDSNVASRSSEGKKKHVKRESTDKHVKRDSGDKHEKHQSNDVNTMLKGIMTSDSKRALSDIKVQEKKKMADAKQDQEKKERIAKARNDFTLVKEFKADSAFYAWLLNETKDAIIPELSELVGAGQVSAFSDTFDHKLGDVEYGLGAMKVKKFEVPLASAKITFTEPSTIVFVWTNVSAQLKKFEWFYEKKRLPKVADKGHARCSITKSVITVSCSAKETPETFQLQAHSCSVNIGELELEIGGSSASALYKVVISSFKKSIKHKLQRQLEEYVLEYFGDSCNEWIESYVCGKAAKRN
jgi:hypothetical protein